jgi:hypothetical protein
VLREGQGEAIDDDVQGCLGFFFRPSQRQEFSFFFLRMRLKGKSRDSGS